MGYDKHTDEKCCLHSGGLYLKLEMWSGGLLCKFTVYPGINIVTQLCHQSILDLVTVQLKIPPDPPCWKAPVGHKAGESHRTGSSD